MSTDNTQKLEATQRLPTIDEKGREGEFGEELTAQSGTPLPWRVNDDGPVLIEAANGAGIARVFPHAEFDHKQVAKRIVEAVNGEPAISPKPASTPKQVEFIVQRLNTSAAELTKAGKALADGWRNKGWTVVYETINTVVVNDRLEHWYSARLEKDVDEAPDATSEKAETVPDEPPSDDAWEQAPGWDMALPETPDGPDDESMPPGTDEEETVTPQPAVEAAPVNPF